MKRILLQLCLPIGLSILITYKILNHFIVVDDIVGVPMFIVSVTCLMISCVYSGWCIGKGKSPYNFKYKKGE